MSMTISQVLRRIAKLKGQFSEQLSRASAGVTYFEGEEPAFRFGPTLEQADATRRELIRLEAALRRANAETTVEVPLSGGQRCSLAEATIVLAEGKSRISWLRALAVLPQPVRVVKIPEWDAGSMKQMMVSRTQRCDLPEAKLAEMVQKEQESFDLLNDAVETINHRTEVKGL